MREMGLEGVIRGKPVKTTRSDKAASCPLDRVNRQFQASAPNRLWVSDFTYVATWAGFVYVAFVIDTFARRIVGWRVSRTAHAGLVLDALEQALHDRRPVRSGGLVHHSDRGSQYVSNTPSAWPRPASNLRWAASAVLTTTRWPRRSTASTRPKLSIDAGRGATSKRSSSPHWNGWIGSTIAGGWSPLATSRQPRPRNATTPQSRSRRWPRDSNESASGKPGAVHRRSRFGAWCTKNIYPIDDVLEVCNLCKEHDSRESLLGRAERVDERNSGESHCIRPFRHRGFAYRRFSSQARMCSLCWLPSSRGFQRV